MAQNLPGRWGGFSRMVATLPSVGAMMLILCAGLLVDRTLRFHARENQRIEAQYRVATLASGLERAIRAEARTLSEFGHGVVDAGRVSPEGFAPLAERLTDGPGALRALAIQPLDGPPLSETRGAPLRDAVLAGIPEAASFERAGTRLLRGASPPAVLFWLPLRSPRDGAMATTGRVAGLLDLPPLFTEAGFGSAAAGVGDARRSGLRLALVDGEGPLDLLDGAKVLTDRPVLADIRVVGSDWQLAAVPSAGWDASGPGVWPVWLLTLIAVGLTFGLMMVSRRLSDERQRNVDALREREMELSRLSRRLRLALDASKVGVWDYDFTNNRLVWDRRMDELYALPEDGRPRNYLDWRGRLHPDDLARAAAEFDEAINVTGRYDSDYRLLLPDGSIRHIRAIGAVYREADGSGKIVGVNWDVSADVRRNAELETKRREAEAASIAKSQFLATMSHEIRTPMNGVIGMLDLLLRTELDPVQRERAAIASDSARQLLVLLNDVLDLSKLEANRISLRTTPTDVAALARSVVALMSATAQERRLRLMVDVAPGVPPLLLCDALRLRQVLVNLVGNAVKFTESGSVQVEVDFHDTPPRPELSVAVRDTGVGIPEAARAALFQRFAQVDSSITRRRGGTGLGLAICKELVELMGGEISVDSVPDLGSTFRFRIPAEPVAAVAQPAAPLAPPTPPRIARILVAEDNATNREVLMAYLAADGHLVRMVTNGAEAVAELQHGSFDLILMDIQMPLMDGITASRRIRALDPPHCDVPIIALTANAFPDERAACLAAGMSDFVAKPVSPESLGAAIARAAGPIRRSGPEPRQETA